ncbi:MAG TPA: AAA family ATPase [Xanthobacteraceae bacterium]|nr:AAA family ATPase [Xanthobacteraceae bacterium]
MSRTTQNLAEWLGECGLSQYAQTFAENHIEYGVLPYLTDDDLKHLGVSLGHRKRLLKAIEALTAGQHQSAASRGGAEVLAPVENHDPELRQITVIFSDLVGSTELSEKLDPEDLRTLIDTYRETCRAAIARYEGQIANFAGDGVMAFFGWPRAHEDDAVRAVHASLEILAEVMKIPGAVTLAARAAICSGRVVVGQTGGPAGWMEAVGETPNIAARLQMLAAPNTLLVSDSTQRLASAAFDFQDLGLQELKGVSKPVRVHRVLAAKHSATRFEAAHTSSLTSLVGRSTELSLLLDRWQKAKEGDGQVVLLSGIPGVGKSRLIHELKSSIRIEPYSLLNYQCSPYHSQSAFFPVIEQIELAAELTANDSDADKFAKINTYLPRLVGDQAEAALLLAHLLSIPIDDRGGLSALTPQQIKNKTLDRLLEMILSSSVERPTLCIFEDVHWIDPSTLELLDLAISRIERAPVMIVASHRPEFRRAWPTPAHATLHSLTQLSRSEVTRMITELASEESLSQPILDQIIDKADGVPLFIEELTTSMLSAPRQNRPQKSDFEGATPIGVAKVPETLHDALMERLDRVVHGRRLAQIAAVIGREFSYDLLTVASRTDETDLRSTLSRLEAADIIYRTGVLPSVRFAFKHALLRDAVYNSLLRGRRQEIHADIAAMLENHFRDLAENRPEILAYHYGEAGNNQRASRCWRDAGRHALASSANVEAISHFRNALQCLSTLPDTPERTREEIEIQLALGIPVIAVQGYAAAQAREAFERARALCLDADNSREYFQALFGLWGHAWMGAKNDEALAMANEFLSRARTSSDGILLMVGHRMMGSTLLTIGEFPASQRHFEESIALSKGGAKRPLYDRYMVEPQVASLLLLSWDLWFLGHAEQALARVSEALALAQDFAHPYSIAFAHYMTSVVHLLRGDPARALQSAEQSLETSREQRFALYELLSTISRGRALAELGQLREAIAEIQRGLAEGRRAGVGFMLPMMHGWLADAHARTGDNETALSIVEQTLDEIGDATGRSWEAELQRQRADILLSLDPSKAAEAESYLQSAIEIARRQSAKTLELRAATGLAELWRRQRRINEAHDLLEPIYRWFEEGADTVDLKRARDVLQMLH